MVQDEQLSKLDRMVQLVVGIGKLTSLELILVTQGFEAIQEASQCASYAGVAPFSYRSGKSLRRRDRVSLLANKRLKKLLHLGALPSIRYAGELKTYYERKVGEGKTKMLELNAVRNKLLHRVYACVREGGLYEVHYTGGRSA